MILYILKRLIGLGCLLYTLMIIARLLGGWIPQLADHPIMREVAIFTDPYLSLFRQFIPPVGTFDLSPIVAILGLQVAQWLIFLIL